MGGKLKQPLTWLQKKQRGAPLRRHEDRQRAVWFLGGGLFCGWLIMLLKDLLGN